MGSLYNLLSQISETMLWQVLDEHTNLYPPAFTRTWACLAKDPVKADFYEG